MFADSITSQIRSGGDVLDVLYAYRRFFYRYANYAFATMTFPFVNLVQSAYGTEMNWNAMFLQFGLLVFLFTLGSTRMEKWINPRHFFNEYKRIETYSPDELTHVIGPLKSSLVQEVCWSQGRVIIEHSFVFKTDWMMSKLSSKYLIDDRPRQKATFLQRIGIVSW